uniref:formimidoyltransferase-cyclodeaminase-like n=1 Tax=Styela clava TaxID=7725 RepID=UPI001939DB2A|nr:formimidoyltransferase-cyclodeaminase-like [Styela clava]
MAKLVECVPNFSEGRDSTIIQAIADAIKKTPGCSVLDVDPGASTNRTVYTFVGSPDDVVNGALAGARAAYQLIDMTKHKGEHPRMGALDVCPFIPVKNATIDDCTTCANEFGKRIAEELNIPIYLYGFSANEEKRKLLPSIRSGEYENLPNKLSDSEWKPDYGPATFVPSWGATATGARNFLIAYNVNLLSTKEQAHRIALDLRETGRGKGTPGKLKNVQGIGWYLKEQNLAQISTNITDYTVTPIHMVYEEAKKCAEELKLPVTGSEVVGLVPLDSILQAAEFYIEKEHLFVLEERDKVRLAINRLSLNSLGQFDPDKRIIEYCVRDDAKDFPLGSLTLKNFIASVGERTPAPGGGSVSAAVAAMGAALGTMAGLMTYGKRQWESQDDLMRKNIPSIYNIMSELIPMIDQDAKAFDGYMAAMKMPRKTEEEIANRNQAMQEGIVQAIRVPQKVIDTVNQSWVWLTEIAQNCNISCASDIQVGVKCLETGAWGAFQNVLINLKDVKDETIRDRLRDEAEKSIVDAQNQSKTVLEIIQNRLN